MSSAPDIRRVRHELRLRRATVARVERLAPKLVRVSLNGNALRGFTSLGFDDHVKLFFPGEDGVLHLPELGPNGPARNGSEPIMRDFTPRRFDSESGELSIDFFLHGRGPAARWAAQAAPGQELGVGGPRGSSVISLDGIDSHVLIGDETALPAIERRLDELPAGAHALAVVEVDAGNQQLLSSRADVETVWVIRDPRYTAPAEQLLAVLRDLELPSGRCFVWAATETQGARVLRRHLTDERSIEKAWIKAAGYWQRGAVGAHVIVDD